MMNEDKESNLELEEKRRELENVYREIDELYKSAWKIPIFNPKFYDKRENFDKKTEQLYQKADLICKQIHLLRRPVASNEKIDIYLEEGSDIRDGYGRFEIYLHGTFNKIGSVRLNREFDDVFGNVGYGLDEKYRGQRFMLQSLELLKDTMLKMKIVKPIITVEPDNMPSVRTIQNFGGVLIKNHKEYNTYYDTYEVDLTEDSNKKR